MTNTDAARGLEVTLRTQRRYSPGRERATGLSGGEVLRDRMTEPSIRGGAAGRPVRELRGYLAAESPGAHEFRKAGKGNMLGIRRGRQEDVILWRALGSRPRTQALLYELSGAMKVCNKRGAPGNTGAGDSLAAHLGLRLPWWSLQRDGQREGLASAGADTTTLNTQGTGQARGRERKEEGAQRPR